MNTSFVMALLAMAAAVPAWAAETYRNPIIDENLADPAVIRHDGTYYLYATGAVDGDNGYRVYTFVQLPGFRVTVQPMASPTEPAGAPRVVLQPESAWETRNGHVTEGPWMIKHDDRYYLLYSDSGADTPDYAVGYATSTSPLGPCTRAEHNLILHRADGLFGPGHGCAIRDGGGQWWFAYHQKGTARREWDRFICIDPLRFDEQGRLHGQATRGQMLPGPALWKD